MCSAQPDAGKTGGGRRVNGLSPGSSYDFAVATCTDAELVASVGPKTKAITASAILDVRYLFCEDEMSEVRNILFSNTYIFI